MADQVVVVGLGSVIKDFKRLHRFLSGPEAMMSDIAVKMHQGTLKRFVNQVDPQGNPWIPSKRASREGGQTLRDTGRLMNSIRFSSDARKAEVFTELEYAAPHQTGMRAGRNRSVKLPVRQFIGLSEEDERQMIAEVEDSIEEALR